MGLDRSGAIILTPIRTVTANDDTYPTANAPTGSIEVPRDARGSICHVLVYINGNAADPAAIVTILAQPFGTEDLPIEKFVIDKDTTFRSAWVQTVQCNDGGAITPTTVCPATVVPASNDVYYAESFSHLSAYKRLMAIVTGIANADAVSVAFAFEKLA